jgi:hypothetical protein
LPQFLFPFIPVFIIEIPLFIKERLPLTAGE